MKENLLPTLVLVLCLGYSPCLGDDGSARRYAEFTGGDGLVRAFCLLEREDVQHELKMTAEQVAKVKHAVNATAHEIPGLLELGASYKKRQADVSLSESDRKKLKDSFSADLRNCLEQFQKRELSSALSAVQRKRLAELVIQMRGPVAIVEDPAISGKLQLGDEQLTAMRQVVKSYAELKWLQARYGRQQISGARYANETPEDRQKELEGLFHVIREIERARDGALLLNFTPQQRASWTAIQGKPFPITWPATSVLDILPFQDGKGDIKNQVKKVPELFSAGEKSSRE